MTASCVCSNNWTSVETSTLIAMWSEGEVQRIYSPGNYKNTKAYARIGDRMKRACFDRSAAQIQAKLKNVQLPFSKAKDATITTSRASSDAATRFCPL